MRSPKPQCIYPVPGAQIANDDEDEAADDEHDDGDVQREHYIGQKLIWKRVVHTRCLTIQANRRACSTLNRAATQASAQG